MDPDGTYAQTVFAATLRDLHAAEELLATLTPGTRAHELAAEVVVRLRRDADSVSPWIVGRSELYDEVVGSGVVGRTDDIAAIPVAFPGTVDRAEDIEGEDPVAAI